MKVKVFAFSMPYFSLTWKIDPNEVELAVADWLARNPDAKVVAIKHDAVTSFWYPPQLFVSLYHE